MRGKAARCRVLQLGSGSATSKQTSSTDALEPPQFSFVFIRMLCTIFKEAVSA